jgi:hypothetical protein
MPDYSKIKTKRLSAISAAQKAAAQVAYSHLTRLQVSDFPVAREMIIRPHPPECRPLQPLVGHKLPMPAGSLSATLPVPGRATTRHGHHQARAYAEPSPFRSILPSGEQAQSVIRSTHHPDRPVPSRIAWQTGSALLLHAEFANVRA